jgi:hypothetical protein
MPNTNQILFIVIIVIIFSISLIGIFYLMNKASNRRRELFDLEQRLQIQEQIHIEYLTKNHQQQSTMIYQPAMIKQGHSPIPSPIVIMTPTKKSESILEKVYGFRTVSSSLLPPPPICPPAPQRPSSIRPPSFLPMKEAKISSPPAYGDYRNSTPLLVVAQNDNLNIKQ